MNRKCLAILIFLLCASFIFGQSNEMEIIGHFIFLPDISITFTNETESYRRLDMLAADLISRNLSPGQILVAGFAAMEPTTLSPVILSLNRSSFIINELVKRGVPWELFATPVGYGYVSFWGSLYENRRATVSIIDSAASGCCDCTDFADRLAHVEVMSERLSAEWDQSPIRTGAITGWFAGAGPEVNGYTRTNFSVGVYASLGIELFHHYVLGLRIGYYDNLRTGVDPYDWGNLKTNTMECALLFRYYLPLPGVFYGIFMEGNVGFNSFREMTPDSATPKTVSNPPHGGFAVGWRFEFFDRFYVDPAIRFGTPFGWGIGIAGGVIF